MKDPHYVKKNTAQKKKFWVDNPINDDVEIKIEGISPFYMHCKNDDSVVKDLYWTDFKGWERTSLTLWKNLLEIISSESTVLDIGAYSGVYSLIASKFNKVKHIFAFDIQDICIERLNKNFALNDINNGIVTKAACSDANGEIEFFYYQEDGIMTSVAGIVPKKMNNLKKFVNSIVLDDWVSKKTLENISLIKIDVEGAEQSTLEGMANILKSFTPDVLIEVNESKDLKKIKRLFPKAYNLYDIDESSLRIKKLNFFTKPTKHRNYLLSLKSKADLKGIFEGSVV
jgi:FkbM family methyltransferase